MPNENKSNLQFFEAASMRELYGCMRDWQDINQKRLLSMCIQEDNGKFCCITLTNPSEVVIADIISTKHKDPIAQDFEAITRQV